MLGRMHLRVWGECVRGVAAELTFLSRLVVLRLLPSSPSLQHDQCNCYEHQKRGYRPRKTHAEMEDDHLQLARETRGITVLEALKEVSQHLQQKKSQDADNLKELLELKFDSEFLSSDPNLYDLRHHLARLKTLAENLQKSRSTVRSFLSRRSCSRQISRIAAVIETEIQLWIDRQNAENIIRNLRNETSTVDEKDKLLSELVTRVSRGFNLELQDVLLKSGVFSAVESVLCDATAPKAIRERSGSAVAAMVQFNKDVFVGQVFQWPTVKSLICLASGKSMQVLCELIRSIKSPIVDEIESNGQIPKIINLLSSTDMAVKLQVMEVVTEIGYFGRKEAIEAMLEEGIIDRLVAIQRSEAGGNLIEMEKLQEDDYEECEEDQRGDQEAQGSDAGIYDGEKEKKSRERRFIEKHPFASCVARFAIQLEVGQGLREREKRAFKVDILQKVKEAAASDSEAATILAEVLWGASPW